MSDVEKELAESLADYVMSIGSPTFEQDGQSLVFQVDKGFEEAFGPKYDDYVQLHKADDYVQPPKYDDYVQPPKADDYVQPPTAPDAFDASQFEMSNNEATKRIDDALMAIDEGQFDIGPSKGLQQ